MKSTKRIAWPNVGQRTNNLSLDIVDGDGTTQSVAYQFNNNVLTKNYTYHPENPMEPENVTTTIIARNLANTDANPIFERISENSVRVNLIFSDPAMRPNSSFTFSAILSLKNKVALTLYDDNLAFDLNSVYFTDSSDGWAVGDGGVILNYVPDVDGNLGWSDWNASNPQPTNNNLNSVKMLNSDLGYIAVDDGNYLYGEFPGAWQNRSVSVTNMDLNDISVEDNNNITALGGDGNSGVIVNYDSTSWTKANGAMKSLNSYSEYLSNKYAIGNEGYIYSPQTVMVGGNLQLDSTWNLTVSGWAENDIDIIGNNIYVARIGNTESVKEFTLTSSGATATGRSWGSNVNSFEVSGSIIYTLSNASLRKIDMSSGSVLAQVSPGAGPNYGLEVEGNYVYATDVNTGIVKRYDLNLGNATTLISGVTSAWAVKVDPYKNIIYVSNSGGILKYSMLGASQGALASIADVKDMEIDDNGDLWAVKGNTGKSTIYRIDTSTGASSNWLSPSSVTTYGLALDSSQRIYLSEYSWSGSPKIYRMIQAGGAPQTQWRPALGAPIVSDNLNGSSIIAKKDNSLDYFLWVVGDNGVIRSYESDLNLWHNIDGRTNSKLNAAFFFNEDNGFIVGDGGIILRWDGQTLDRVESPTTENLKDVHLYGNDRGWIVGSNGTRIKIGEF